MSFTDRGIQSGDIITIDGVDHVVVPFPWYKRAWWWLLERFGIQRRPISELRVHDSGPRS